MSEILSLDYESSMAPAEVAERFEALQEKLVPLWQTIGRSDPGGPAQQENTVVVVPSVTAEIELSSAAHQGFEERFLFMLFLLQQPNLHLIYITGEQIADNIINYYLDILPGVVGSHAHQRLSLVSPLDDSMRPLVIKLLERPRLLRQIRALIPDPDRAHIVPYITTDLERELAVRLDLPMYAADPRFFAFGTKSGSRRVFAEEGVPLPLGFEELTSVEAVAAAIGRMRQQQPELGRAIVKLNEGVGGMGNAVVDLASLPAPGDPAEAVAVAERLRRMRFELESVTYDFYVERVQAEGAIVEAFIAGAEIHSPSTQLRITPLGDIELLSTHDQMLGGPSGQSFLGSRFPAHRAYGHLIMREAAKIGQRLAREGVVGRFAIDFMVVRAAGGEWEPYAIEVNLRKGGTTAPFLTLQYLTDGAYNAEEGAFFTARGHEKAYVSSDHVHSEAYRVFTPDDLFEIISRHRLHFDHTKQTGVVMHMMSAVGASGQLGVTAIGDTHAEAEALYHRFVAALDDEAARAAAE